MPLHQRATVEGCGGDFPVGNVAKGDVELLLGNAGTWDCYPPIDCCSCRCWWKWLVKLSGSISSQYLTALLMAAPLALGDVEIEIIDKLISVPYVEMTLKLMERFGVGVEHNDSWDRFLVKAGQKYKKGLCRRGCIECQLLPCRCGSHWWNCHR